MSCADVCVELCRSVWAGELYGPVGRQRYLHADALNPTPRRADICTSLQPSHLKTSVKTSIQSISHPNTPSKLVMPKRPPCEDAAALAAKRAALDDLLPELRRRLRKEQKAACARQSRELAARARTLQRAMVVLALYDSDRNWLPAFMTKHGLSGVGEEKASFQPLQASSKFLQLLPEEVNALRSPSDQRGHRMLREAQVFVTNHQLHAWVSKQNDCHGITPTVGDTLMQRDELAAAHLSNKDGPPIWSVASSARYKWGERFRQQWRLTTRKSQAREAVPVHVAREKADVRECRV